MPQSKSPKAQYQRRLDEGVLKPDPIQKRAIQALDRLYWELVEISEHSATCRGWRAVKEKIPFLSTAPEAARGLYMYGGVGRGKSMLMDLFYDCLPESIPKRRVHFHAFMIELHDYHHARRRQDDVCEGMDGILPLFAERIAERVRVLCFDEFHVTDVADAMILGRLFRHLFERGVVVVATSNWEPERLYEGGLQRDRFLPFIDLLKEKMEVMHLDGPVDYRTKFLMQEGTYFWPLGQETTRHANTVFNALTDNAVPDTDTLEVKGRTIEVEAVARGVARFTFAQLCERPHGAEDYLEIVNNYHTVFVEGIPALGYDRRNEAKRFMILIDTLYEAGTKLVATAEALPDQLYRGHDHAFEFQRTVSRLQEMQSAEYLA
ncbi:MAG: cell division protein ZapE [Rhodospirillales bacterium]|nr:AFG1 family ATPase [Alphaproteobacteria bacterium]MCB9981087.1 cell division protein ZapE [Rhodospirillales bacterium]